GRNSAASSCSSRPSPSWARWWPSWPRTSPRVSTRRRWFRRRGDTVAQVIVVLPLDHPFARETRFASLLVRDRDLANNLIEGFGTLWKKAMRSLQEVSFDPRRAVDPTRDD